MFLNICSADGHDQGRDIQGRRQGGGQGLEAGNQGQGPENVLGLSTF